MKTCKDCQHFSTNTIKLAPNFLNGDVFICDKQHSCLSSYPICRDFKEMKNNIDLSYLYIGLFNSGELGLTEISQDKTDYCRVEMGPGDWEFTKEDSITNIVDVEFSNAINSWGLITHFGVFNSLFRGQLLVIGKLNALRFVNKNDRPKFDIGSMDITLEALGVYNSK